jgi:predicted nucleic acid-binding protein
MAAQYQNPVFLDTTVLSNFASTTGIDLLTTLLETPVVTPAVRDELEDGLAAGHGYLETAVSALGDSVAVRAVASDDAIPGIRERLDAGEAESLLGVVEHGDTIATDDLAARRIATSRDIPVTGSIGLLVLGVEREHIGEVTADEWLDTWRHERGYYAPVQSVTELLDDE